MLHRGSNCSLARAMDGRITHRGIISSCQSAAEIVKRFWSRVHVQAALTFTFYLFTSTCIETTIFELPVKLLIISLDSATPSSSFSKTASPARGKYDYPPLISTMFYPHSISEVKSSPFYDVGQSLWLPISCWIGLICTKHSCTFPGSSVSGTRQLRLRAPPQKNRDFLCL